MPSPSAPAFAPPLSAARTRSPSPEPDAERYLSTPTGELAFFRALIQHRPVGLDKHWEMIGVALHLRDHVGEDAKIEQGELWDKYRELYDEETLQTTWEGEQMDALEEDEGEEGAPAEAQEDDWIDVRFPRKDFTLLVPPSKITPNLDESLFASLADRISQRAEREEGALASPPPGPVREFSLELPDEEVEEEEEEEEEEQPRGRETRGKGRESRKATESESPKKKKAKVAPKEEEGTEMSGSDLSELEDDEEEEAEEDEDGEEGTEASRASDAEEYEDKASAIARLPSSKRKRATRSASAPTSDAASTSHMSAADLKKEKSKLAMRAKRAKAKAEKEAAAAAAGGEPKPKEKAKRKRG